MSKSEDRKETILVIDDEQEINEMVVDALGEEGYSTSAALNAAQGFELFEKIHPDLVLLDIALPDSDGIKLCKKITQHKKNGKTPVIMMTAKSDIKSRITSFVAGAHRYIVKPFKVETLLKEIENALRLKRKKDR